MAKLVSSTYGDALFELAVEKNNVDEIFDEIVALREAFLENPELLKLMNHPKIVKEEKETILENILKGRFSDDVTGFAMVIVKKGRYNEFHAIFDYFIHKVKEYKGIGTAYVTTAVTLKEEQKNAIEQRLLELTRYNQFEIIYKVDAGLIAGMIIRIEDRVVDTSIRTQLANMKKQLVGIQL